MILINNKHFLRKNFDTDTKYVIFVTMKLSIIIPVYNAKPTIARCIESLLRQSFRDYQLILVDDASTDGSKEICDDYVAKDHRIQIVKLQKNGGVSAARNAGLKKARGEYLTFVDADDVIARGTLKKVMNILAVRHDYDILEYPVWTKYGSPKQRMMRFSDKEYYDMAQYWLESRAYEHTFAYNKIYKRALFEDITYPEGQIFEDAQVYPQLLERCNIVATTSEGMYYYCYNEHGLTENARGEQLRHLLATHLQMINKGICDEEYYKHVLNIQLDVCEQTGDRPTLPIKPYSSTLKLKLLHILGLRLLCKTNKLLHIFYRRSH